jgi:hypothetical protein
MPKKSRKSPKKRKKSPRKRIFSEKTFFPRIIHSGKLSGLHGIRFRPVWETGQFFYAVPAFFQLISG